MAVVANALREAHQIDLLDPDVLVSDALQLDSPHLNRRVGFFMEMYGIPGWEPLALRVGRKHAIPLSPRSVGGEAGLYPVNPRWRVYEDPMIVGAAEEPK